MQVISEANHEAVTHTTSHVATNFFARTKQYFSLQLSTSPHPQPQAQSHFTSLTRRQLRAWSSLLLRVGTLPQQSIAGLLPQYTTLPPPPAAALAHAQALVTQMRQRMPTLPVTSDSIKASPHLYLPWMWHILQYVEPLAAAHVRGSKLFTMVPQCGNQAQVITITSTCLHRYAFFCICLLESTTPACVPVCITSCMYSSIYMQHVTCELIVYYCRSHPACIHLPYTCSTLHVR